MTEPRRWPKRAEEYRMKALASAMQIGDLVREASMAVLEEELIRAVILLSEVALKAKEIEEWMRTVKQGRR